MGKTALTNSSIENQSYFQEHLRRTNRELFEWHLILYSFWLSIPLRNKKKFTRESVITKGNAEFRKNYSEMLEKIIQENGQDRMCFPENAAKEYAIKYYLKNYESREFVKLDKQDNFRLLSNEALCLSIIYANFFEYRKKLGLDAWYFESTINSLMKDVIGEANALIGYRRLNHERRKTGSEGGKHKKRLPGILLAIEKLLQDNKRKNYSAERLWEYFEKDHKGKKKALKGKDFKVYFNLKNTSSDEERLFQISRSGIIKSIGRSAFNGYVKEVKKIKIIYK